MNLNHLKEPSQNRKTAPGGNTSIQIGWGHEPEVQQKGGNNLRTNKARQAEEDKAKQAMYHNQAM